MDSNEGGVEETWGSVYGNLINREKMQRGGEGWRGWSMMRGCEILGRDDSCDSFLEHLCFALLGVMSMEGQETERFL